MQDKKVLAVLSAKPPRMYKRTADASYYVAQERWRERWAAYKDAYCMAFCGIYKNKVARAFYGVEMKWVEL